MKPALRLLVTALLAGAFMYVSCKKEYSCESCSEKNKPPIAVAGPDQVITLPTDSASLDGRSSSDRDGSITAYKWTKISGPASFNMNNSTSALTLTKNLIVGSYLFELKVTDNGGLSATDTMRVLVDALATPNHPPIANAGTDQTITLPINMVTLDGSASTDPDNNITSYVWTKMSGPASSNIANANIVQTQTTNLVEGIYKFELKVTDAGGLFSKDSMQVTIINQPCSQLPSLLTACDNSIRPQICAQLIPIGTLSLAGDRIATASAGSKIVFAGRDCCPGSSRVDIYDTITQTWSIAELSVARWGIAAVVSGNKIFFAGGELGDGAFDIYYSTVDIYDVSSNTWSVASLSEPRSEIAAAAVGNKVLFAGGEKDMSYNTSDKVDIYDVSSNIWSTALLSEPRSFISAVTVNNKIYFAGGGASQFQWNNNFSNRIDIYDNATNTWSTSSLIESKAMFAGIAVANRIYWAGGFIESAGWGLTCQVEIKDVNTQNSSIDFLFKAGSWWTNFGENAVIKDNKIIFFRGGWFNVPDNKFDIYDTVTDRWSIGVLNQNIEGASLICVNNIIYVAGGYVNGVASNQVWKLEF